MLDLRLPSGGRIRTTWDAPAGHGRGWAWVQHGFTRHASHLTGLAGLLAAAGLAVVRPDVGSFGLTRSIHDAGWITEVAITIARAIETGIPQSRGIHATGPWSILGHSAGGAVAVHVASCLATRHQGVPVRALVLLDPVDTPRRLLAGSLDGTAMAAVGRVHAFRPSRCNRGGATAGMLAQAGWPVLDHPELAHPDPERIPADAQESSVGAADPRLSRLCGPPGAPADIVGLARRVEAEMTLGRGLDETSR